MPIKRFSGDTLIGLSSDTKPLNIMDGARFFESDTLIIYLKVNGSWVPITALTNDYVVLVTQTGTDNPVLSVKENGIGLISCVRIGVGTYNFISDGLFTVDKTVPYTDIMQDQNWNLYKLNWIDVNTIQLRTYAAADISVLADGICNNSYINFKVYN